MAEVRKEDNCPRGFLVVLESSEDHVEKHWSDAFLQSLGAKASSTITIKEPDCREILEKVHGLFMTYSRVTLLVKPYPIDHIRERMMRDIQRQNPDLEIIGMTYF